MHKCEKGIRRWQTKHCYLRIPYINRCVYLSLEKSRGSFLWALSLYELLAVPDIQSAVNRIDNAPAHEVVCGEVCGIFIH